jgi:alpha-1,6-mannosyltransferase
LALLALASVPLAAPGAELVPGTGPGAPGWVLGVYGDGLSIDGGEYLAALCLAFIAYLAVALGAGALGGKAIWAAIGIAILVFGLAPPLLSLDVFSYISYARLGAEHGLNPYVSVPADIPSDPAAARVDDWRFAASVYGPLFTLGTYPLGLVPVSTSLWAFKALAAASVLALAYVVARLAAVRGIDPNRAAALVALNPLVLVHVVGGAHNDGTMMLLVMLGVAGVTTGAAAAGGVALVAAAAVKLSAGLVAPFTLAGTARRLRLLAGIGIGAVALAGTTLAAFGGEAANAIGAIGGNQDAVSRYSIPATLSRGLGVDVDPIRVALGMAYGGLLVWLLVRSARGLDWVRAAGWASFGLLVATAYMTPWYVIWALPLAAIARDRVLVGAVLALSAYQLVNAVPI